MKMKTIIITLSALSIGAFILYSFKNRKAENTVKGKGFYNLSIKSLDGKSNFDFSQFKGKKVLLVNVASKCGYTPQYADWQKFHKEHGDKVVVLGFPANNFGGQVMTIYQWARQNGYVK